MLDFGPEWCQDFNISGPREWLVTNGFGGYASGTVAGQLSRRYHGLLVAALNPPLGRTLLVSNFEETISFDDQTYHLYTRQMHSGDIQPSGFLNLERFHLEGTTPVWTYAFAEAIFEKRVWMQSGSNTTYIHYTLTHAPKPIQIRIRSLINFRDHHSETRVGDWHPQINKIQDGVELISNNNNLPYFLLSQNSIMESDPTWYEGFFLSAESYRGLPDVEDLFSPGEFVAQIQPGNSITIVATTQNNCNLDGGLAYSEQQTYEQNLITQSGKADGPDQLKQLILAANQFIVRRSLPDAPDGHTIIAGYPWFGDWGRDTMISLPGLTLSTGRSGVARSILLTFAQYVDGGMLPNNFPEMGKTPGYNTVDATLWYFEAIRAYIASTGDENLLSSSYPVLDDIIDWHQRGTRYSIHQDPLDGLIYAGEEDVQLTWMDAKVDDWVVTPRIGKPVEINALWYNALRTMEDFAERLGKPAEGFRNAAEHTQQGFRRFWNNPLGYCFDVLDGPDGDDASLRPNQVIAASLFHTPLETAQIRKIVDVTVSQLLTSFGLRSLSPYQGSGIKNPDYIGTYGGDHRTRDGAYHQGTVWGWLTGPFISAYLRAYGDPLEAKTYLRPLIQQLSTHGIGSISEIFDGDHPFNPRGCFAQAWSVAEILRAWTEIDTLLS